MVGGERGLNPRVKTRKIKKLKCSNLGKKTVNFEEKEKNMHMIRINFHMSLKEHQEKEAIWQMYLLCLNINFDL